MPDDILINKAATVERSVWMNFCSSPKLCFSGPDGQTVFNSSLAPLIQRLEFSTV